MVNEFIRKSFILFLQVLYIGPLIGNVLCSLAWLFYSELLRVVVLVKYYIYY